MNTVHVKYQSSLRSTSAYCSAGLALCYVILFIIYGAILELPTKHDFVTTLAFIGGNQLMLKCTYYIGYVLFACLLVLFSLSFSERLSSTHVLLYKLTNTAAVVWATALLFNAMIQLATIDKVLALAITDTIAAHNLYRIASMFEYALGGGFELFGGIWLALTTLCIWQLNHKVSVYLLLTALQAVVGICTLMMSVSVLRDVFGILGIIWFVWTALTLFKQKMP